MNRSLPLPFTELDAALANRICQWLGSDDKLLWYSIAAVSLSLNQGHSCLALDFAADEEPYNQLEMAFPEPDLWLRHLTSFAIQPQHDAPIVLENRRLYLRRYWNFESELSQFFQQRFSQTLTPGKAEIALAKQLLDQFFPKKTDTIDWQRIAAMNCLLNNTSLIIGGPGTGKTYTVTRILALLASLQADQPLKIKLAAPTGKAAQRLAEAISSTKQTLQLDMLVADCIPDSAQTLHRLLGVIPQQIDFRHHEKNPLDADLLLIDEVSMVDLPLMTRLCRAIRPQTRLILLGDADQLPSVAAGSVLADLVQRPHPGFSAERIAQLKKLDNNLNLKPSNNGLDYATELQHSRRFSADSGIGHLARHIITGQNKSQILFDQHPDLQWHNDNQFEQLLRQWTTHYGERLIQQTSLTNAFNVVKSFRILCATKEDEWGVKHINQRIQNRLNPSKQPFYRGQPIMITQNNYSLKLFNGDIGLIWPDDEGTLMAWFENGEQYRAVALGRLPGVETVYAMTIHKTQGSEFDHVAMVLPPSGSQLLCRELLYTGLTRAKSTFSCVGRMSVWDRAVQRRVERWSGLVERLVW
ncbi:MAG: exodeoxyribonuclease V subunit alpha [Reinekea sp.]